VDAVALTDNAGCSSRSATTSQRRTLDVGAGVYLAAVGAALLLAAAGLFRARDVN
jgi:hypothetical protein